MKKCLLFAAAVFAAVSAMAAPKGQQSRIDANVNRVGTEVARASFFAYETEELAQKGDKQKSTRYLSMEGKWKFKFVTHHYTTAPRLRGSRLRRFCMNSSPCPVSLS